MPSQEKRLLAHLTEEKRHQLEALWQKLIESAEAFRRKYRLLPNGKMVNRAEYAAMGDGHAHRS